ncbi:MAG TPA: DNA polymerase III subunit gamma/tau [Candidatus Limnocylindria bacterium]|nr:DNA polymerase III subunit gamma/tau [Candidatus Limnocylindria bacterium]
MSSYQVIARKYRPQRFSDVVGQEHVTQTLSHAIEAERIAHAYLFCGPRGTGKTTIARIFAKALNCTGGPKVDFDDDDPRCREITEGRSLDVMEIDGASNNGVEQVRELRETCKYAPASAKFKIYIIDEVHMLSTAAFNALLKTLEEPPAHVKFMFATTDPEKVLPTILSRCQRFDLRRIPIKLMVDHLKHIAKQENVQVEDAALHAIARGADGGMRDAESALDQLISFCGEKIVEADVLSMFGLTSQSQLLSLSNALLQGDVQTVLAEFNSLAKHGKDLGKFLSDLLQHLRNLLVFQISRGDTRLLEVSEAEAATLTEQSALVGSDGLTRIMEVLTQTDTNLRDASSKNIFIEVALIKAIEARNSVSIDSVLKRLNELRGDAGSPSSAPSPTPAPARSAVTPAPAAKLAPAHMAETPPAPAAVPATSNGVDAQTIWPNLVEAIGRASPFARSYFLEAHPVSFVKNVFTIGFDPEFADHIGMVDNAKNHALIATKLAELGHSGAQVQIVKVERPESFAAPVPAVAPTPSAPPAPAQTPAPATTTPGPARAASPPVPKPVQLDPSDFKNDPLIKKALEVFKGTIVEVRA